MFPMAQRGAATWVYLASSTQTDLPSTLQAVVGDQLLWRPATNSLGALIANVGQLRIGDSILVAWRADRKAYLRCRIAAPLRPLVVNGATLVIDGHDGADADALLSRGYRRNGVDRLEAIRFDEIDECCFPLRGIYGGNNALHRIHPDDEAQLDAAGSIPPAALKRGVPRDLQPARDTRRSHPEPMQRSPAHSTSPMVRVDELRIPGTAPKRVFDAYVMVDWSSSSTPTTGNDSIWIANGCWTSEGFRAAAPENLSTRGAAVARIEELSSRWREDGLRVLVGLDFAFGYPAGFAEALGLPDGKEPWRAVHEHIARNVSDDEQNRHNRDAFAEACNRTIAPIGPGPFWACNAKAATSILTQQRKGVFEFPYAGRLKEWRVADERARERTVTQSVWKLNCGVSVGGQTIVGIKHLHELATTLGGSRWPFDTGWATPPVEKGCIWFAEIFPSLVRYAEWDDEYAKRRDRTQVQSCVRRAAEEDRDGILASRFAEPAGLTGEQASRVVSEEGWILWV